MYPAASPRQEAAWSHRRGHDSGDPRRMAPRFREHDTRASPPSHLGENAPGHRAAGVSLASRFAIPETAAYGVRAAADAGAGIPRSGIARRLLHAALRAVDPTAAAVGARWLNRRNRPKSVLPSECRPADTCQGHYHRAEVVVGCRLANRTAPNYLPLRNIGSMLPFGRAARVRCCCEKAAMDCFDGTWDCSDDRSVQLSLVSAAQEPLVSAAQVLCERNPEPTKLRADIERTTKRGFASNAGDTDQGTRKLLSTPPFCGSA